MDVMGKGNESDSEHGPVFYAVLEKFQAGKYREDVFNRKIPAVSVETSEQLAEEILFFIIKNANIINMNVSEFKEELNI